MPVFNVAGYLIEERHRWPVIWCFPISDLAFVWISMKKKMKKKKTGTGCVWRVKRIPSLIFISARLTSSLYVSSSSFRCRSSKLFSNDASSCWVASQRRESSDDLVVFSAAWESTANLRRIRRSSRTWWHQDQSSVTRHQLLVSSVSGQEPGDTRTKRQWLDINC